MLTLYHAPQSRSSRVVWLLEELGAEYDIAYMDIPRMDGSGAPDPKNPHPEKKVPTLLHDGNLITETIAIDLYLTDLFPDAGIGPKVGDKDRGAYLTWLAYYAGVIEPVLLLQYVGLGDNAELRRTFRGRAEVDQRILSALETSDYILGDRFTAVDTLIVSMGQVTRDMLPAGDAVDAYLERCNARPALAAAMVKDSPPSS